MAFFSKCHQKRHILVSEPCFGEVRGDVRPWLMARWNANGWLSIRVRPNGSIFAKYYGSGITRQNLYSLAVFTRGRPLCTQILPGQGRSPSAILDIRKLDTLGYPKVKIASLCVPSFLHNTRVFRINGQTDRLISRSTHSAGKAALRRAIKERAARVWSSLFTPRASRLVAWLITWEFVVTLITCLSVVPMSARNLLLCILCIISYNVL